MLHAPQLWAVWDRLASHLEAAATLRERALLVPEVFSPGCHAFAAKSNTGSIKPILVGGELIFWRLI